MLLIELSRRCRSLPADVLSNYTGELLTLLFHVVRQRSCMICDSFQQLQQKTCHASFLSLQLTYS